MNRILREPLLHFLLLGGAMFAASGLLSKGGSGEPGRIVVSQGQLATMREAFSRTRQRLPTREEWDGLIRARVREEVYYREALALGLDKDDSIIRRRLQQKMEFVSDDVVAQDQPTEAELNTYLQAHPEQFRAEPRFTFRQVYLNPERRGPNLSRDAAELLARLNQAGDSARVTAMGDALMLAPSFTAAPAGEIAGQFGKEFAAQLDTLQPRRWQGPIKSAFGAHIVFVSERRGGDLPALADVRDEVRREWQEARRREASERFYQQLLKRYAVTIEQSPAEEAKKTAALTRE